LKSYSTVDVKLLYWINHYIQIYGRVENAGNKKYQQANGYAMPQRAFYAGVEGNLF
jgi:vitamin B12 transporter